MGLSGQVLRDFSLSKKAFWPLQAPFTRIWFFQTTFAKWPCSISGSVYNLAVQWPALPPNKPQYCRPGDSCKSGRVGALQQGLRPDDVYQVHLPLFHVVGFTWSLVPAFWAGASELLQPKFSASRFWPAALAHRATVASHAGTDGFLRRQPVPDHAFRQWLFAWHDPDRNEYFRVNGSTGWGMTEMVIPAIAGDASMEQRVLSVGRPYPGYTVRIENDDGSAVRPGETGHLLIGAVRGLSIFQEYVDNPRAMTEAFDARGFFRTGDRVTLHEDGWIEFKDRVKDMIKVGGESVSASEVEFGDSRSWRHC